ncbi:hypothetical protein WME99_25730 [Sorangium sp. So ce136]|uniref:hypothetical protein n=1 Tax=Sorangium sp. So ce136 TaxID=3133284 RepID=UPI003EFFF87A
MTSISERRELPLALGPGLHGATLELKSGRAFQIRTTDGRRVVASLADGVDPALADDCLRTGRMVIVSDTPRGPEIAGAIMTSLPPARSEDGVVTIDAKELRLRAERSLSLEVGPVSLSAEESGAMRLEGDRLVIDMAALVRVFSSRVELP